jgi:hypothetical protein
VSHFPRFKVDVEVFDGDEAAKFVFWDSSLEELLGMTAATLLEKQCQVKSLFVSPAALIDLTTL